MGKRQRGGDGEEREDPRYVDQDRAAPPAGPSGRKEGATIGQRTSSIKNKLVRSELYDKLRHKKAARNSPFVLCTVSEADFLFFRNLKRIRFL